MRWPSSRSWLSMATAAWEARASMTGCSSAGKGTTSPLSGSVALISCSTPVTLSSWFLSGTVRNEVER